MPGFALDAFLGMSQTGLLLYIAYSMGAIKAHVIHIDERVIKLEKGDSNHGKTEF